MTLTRPVADFHGGIHPPENKSQSNQVAISTPPLPPVLILPIQQHIGAPAKPVVNEGDQVLKGQVIAEPVGFVSAPVHAPTSGKVISISQRTIPHPSGLQDICVVIEPDGNDTWVEKSGINHFSELDHNQLLDVIRNAGITGMGGAGFPAAIKLNPSQDTVIKTLIINAVECEPYITADDMLMRERAHDILAGLQVVTHLLQPEQVLIGIEDNKPQAIDAMRVALQQLSSEDFPMKDIVQLVEVPTKYPSGGEKQLIQLLTGQEVPQGGIPADIGIVAHNIGTIYAINRAVYHGEPLISRVTTITGDAVQEQKNLQVLLGTPMSHLLAHCGLQQDKLNRLIMGGPMMGFTINDADVPVVKTTNCLLASTAEEIPDPAPEQNCIRCGMCAEVCPANLLPQQLHWYSKSREFDKALDYNLLDCIECGACSYVCPSNIPLVQYYRFAKGEIRSQEQEQIKSEHAKQRFEARKERLEKEAAEKEAKRKARAKASAEAKAKKAAEAAAAAKEAPAEGTATDQASSDDKDAVVKAALERAEAKKKARAEAKAAAESGSPEDSSPEDKEAVIQAALERAEAKKKARAETAAKRAAEAAQASETNQADKPLAESSREPAGTEIESKE